jgi:hypothetical protein
VVIARSAEVREQLVVELVADHVRGEVAVRGDVHVEDGDDGAPDVRDDHPSENLLAAATTAPERRR